MDAKNKLLLTALILLNSRVKGYPYGAPTDLCDTISPMRTQSLPLQMNDAPYVLLQTAISYKPGQVINVSIQRVDPDSTFEGFMVQAIDKISGRFVGRFLDAEGLHLLDECSAVMQNDSKSKANVQLAWVAPLNQRGDVIFRGTVIEKKTKYYDGLISRLESPR
ncbi:putative defense protein 3 [Argiope bruennichi]|uniref:Putative defense protein 3 like protein n=1 Tax=Argiope bruennichi TaxID=94029 RepID=A0A8T0F241_ARGBR|nr:putative defense protein 3 [Argiope bruennichi]KAF8784532.1 putative defense protein 3 like protein [Argiope bruennichi]